MDETRQPVWVESLEAPYVSAFGGQLYLEGNDLYVIGGEGLANSQQKLLLTYDVSAGRAVLKSRETFDGTPSSYRRLGRVFSVQRADNTQPGELRLRITDYSSGTRDMKLNYTPVSPDFYSEAAGTAKWVAVSFSYPFIPGANYETVAFDIQGAAAEPIAILSSGGFNHSITAFEDTLVVGSDVYYVNGRTVALASQLPASFVVDVDEGTRRLLMVSNPSIQFDGYRVVDLRDRFNPASSAPTVHSTQSPRVAALGPDYFVLGSQPSNLGIYPISWSKGATLVDVFPSSRYMHDLRARDGYLFWTGPGFGVPGGSLTRSIFEVVEISVAPFRVVATRDRPSSVVGWSIELNKNFAYVGTDTELIVYDIADPTVPVEHAVIPAQAISLALAGNILYAGSNAGSNKTLLVYDVSSPGNPRLLNTLSMPNWAYSVATQTGWLAVAMGRSGIYLYSTDDPVRPAFKASLNATYWGVSGSGNHLYVAAAESGLLIFDVRQPQSPLLLSQTSLAEGNEHGDYFPTPLSISLDPRGIAWICTSKDGRVYGLDVREPRRPRHIMEFAMEFATQEGAYVAENAAVWNGILIVSSNDSAFDTNPAQNVGLYRVRQTSPGQIVPDRYADSPPFADRAVDRQEPSKARALTGSSHSLGLTSCS